MPRYKIAILVGLALGIGLTNYTIGYAGGTLTVNYAGLVVIERANGMSSTFKPGFIEISGFELKNAHPDNTYTRQTGGAADAK